ncbi:MAG: murein L,D-transpeptidase catalytic domain family protein, partial [Desulfobacterales bacterium]|nr:murein L,D-transpeptidase catalytic domain family protein [Desulfobacterales bacterium]
SLYLYGMDEGFNDKAKRRGIVVHGAHYVQRSFIKEYGKIGRSQGCPALPAGPHIHIINTIMGGTCLFQFYDDKMYVQKSALLDVAGAASQFREEYAPFIQIKLSDR